MTALTLRLGTRRSALAWVQSSQVAQALRDAHPGLEIEMVGIDTRGDRIQDVPLTGLEGKEFFTAEIDAALREGRVDLTVHSLKDLSLERPAELMLGAVPRRANPRDIAIFAPDVMDRLREGKGLRIGTGSPRRQQLLPPFFTQALPFGDRNTIELVGLRGNVDTRLRRVREPRGSERQLDGIVLALAGLTRLYADTVTERQGRQLLDELLAGLPLMVLPLTDSPSAPGQGALAIECRADDARTRALLAAIDHAPTRAAITAERAVLAEYGGGCHQRFGATAIEQPDAGTLLQIAGLAADGRDIAQRRWSEATTLPAPRAPVRSWNGATASPPAMRPVLDAQALAAQLKGDAVFVAHSRALPEGGAAALAGKRVWTPGSGSWFKLAAQGVWVEGCAEGRGAATAAELVREAVLRLPSAARWSVLTHAGAEAGWATNAWAGAQVIPTYANEQGTTDTAGLATATHVFWSSVSQFDAARHLVAPNAHHASGPGKTADHIRRAGITAFTAFPSAEEWQQWAARAR